MIGAVAACALALSAASPALAQTGDTAEAAAPAQPAATPKGARLTMAQVKPGKAYYFGLKKPRFVLKVAAKRPIDVRIDVLRLKSGQLVRAIPVKGVQPNHKTAVPFDGLDADGNLLRGKFRFLVRGASGKPIPLARKYKRMLRTRSSAKKGKKGRKGKKKRPFNFGLFDHIFPVRGNHTYGDGIGAPRGDHTHQGQDISARCGTKLVAAQGGTVQVNSYQAGGAGYYVVIDTVSSGIDHVYMHLAYRPALTVGQIVMTGQPIGSVGNTGSSSGCHLHFEMWSDPGWYEGGSFMDPTPYMRAWDKYS